ncbi:polyprenyl synthetase family protein [Streptomyces sp. NPDC051940]|uniref:polyprenyl synthetase family protein n=1 Tax=Streptomyces sp. NPDC051940 TaxID=3155675 RepID=UPI00344190A0
MTIPAHPGPWREASPGELHKALLDQVEERLHALLDEEFQRRRTAEPRAMTLVEGISEFVRAGSQRVRAVICLSGFLAAAGDRAGGPAREQAVAAATALELNDTWLQIRADVRDNAPLRRGIPTLHISHAAEHERNGWRGESRRFGEGTAVLAGDLTLAYAGRLAAGLPQGARRWWDELCVERTLGAQASAAAATEYLDDPWPGRCVTDCHSGCAAGWYGLRHALRIGAAVAGREDELGDAFDGYARALHAAWRLRGFLEGGPGYDADALFLRDVAFFGQSREPAERTIVDLIDQAVEAVADAPLAPGWHAELGRLALRVSGCER